jgi:hypothetical protein
MIPVGVLSSYAQAAAGGLAPEFIGWAGSPGNASDYTFTDVPIGNDSSDRMLVLGLAARTGSPILVTGLKVNGLTVAPDFDTEAATSTVAFARVKTSGTTATFVLTLSAAGVRAGMAVWSIPSNVRVEDTDFYTTIDGTAHYHEAVATIPNGGFGIGFSYGHSTTAVSGDDAFLGTDIESGLRLSGCSSTTPGQFLVSRTAQYPALGVATYSDSGSAIDPVAIPGMIWRVNPALLGTVSDPIASWSTFAQADTAKQPVVTQDGSFKYAAFEGGDTLLQSGNQGLSTDQTMFAVVRVPTAAARTVVGASSGTGVRLALSSTLQASMAAHGGDFAAALSAETATTDTWCVVSGRFKTAVSLESRLNANPISSVNTTTVTTQDRFNQLNGNAGGAGTTPMDIAEAWNFRRALTNSEWDGVVSYLMTKYGIGA